MESIKDIIQIIQGVVIICATLFTTWWAYKTFAHKESIEELKNIINTLEDLSFELFFIQRLQKDLKDGRSLDKFLDSLLTLNQSIFSSIYLRKKDREKIVEKVKTLIDIAHEIILEKEENKWNLSKNKFDKQYKELKLLVYSVGQKYV